MLKASPALTVPLRSRSPALRRSGKGSPVTADLSSEAEASSRIPSTGSNSPARTSSWSPTVTSSTAMVSIPCVDFRCATRGDLSVSALRLRSARPRAKSSSTVPPAYMIATTIAARDWPSSSAADIETSAMASTPKRPIQKSRKMEMASAATTGKVAAVQIVPASMGPRPVLQTPIPMAKPRTAMTSKARRRTDSFMRCFPI